MFYRWFSNDISDRNNYNAAFFILILSSWTIQYYHNFCCTSRNYCSCDSRRLFTSSFEVLPSNFHYREIMWCSIHILNSYDYMPIIRLRKSVLPFANCFNYDYFKCHFMLQLIIFSCIFILNLFLYSRHINFSILFRSFSFLVTQFAGTLLDL